ncbi:MAG: hypothetical protein ACRDAI_03170 [Candidatus Rhabdochlamydia sp.]
MYLKHNLDIKAPETVLRLKEAVCFLQTMIQNYHVPDIFLFNLHATVQAIRNITFVMQSELSEEIGFKEWYTEKQSEMRENTKLRKLVEARNILTKRKSLERKSSVKTGLFRYEKMKIAIKTPIHPGIDSISILNLYKQCYGFLIDEEHSEPWMQLGVEREWIMEELGPEEVVFLCNDIIDYFGNLLKELAQIFECQFNWQKGPISCRYQLLLESDLDPTLPKKWGWET